jgi:hypothetical protein
VQVYPSNNCFQVRCSTSSAPKVVSVSSSRLIGFNVFFSGFSLAKNTFGIEVKI